MTKRKETTQVLTDEKAKVEKKSKQVATKKGAKHSEPVDEVEEFEARNKAALNMLHGYLGCKITYPPRNELSPYTSSGHMMDYIVHHINKKVCENFIFKSSNPPYHPYILRLYFGVLFWIQCLRAGSDVGALTSSHGRVLSKFLSAHLLETMPIPGPLMGLFRTLCSSQPEYPEYGKVFPHLPPRPGPASRSDFISDDISAFFHPNIPGIFALINHLYGSLTAQNPAAPPRLGQLKPVTANANEQIVFGHHTFPIPADRSDLERWALCSPGLQYHCEAEQTLNASFVEQYPSFEFPPPTAGTDNISGLSAFLGFKRSMAWFNQVKEVAGLVADLFDHSCTLSDCLPSGLTSNQFVCNIVAPATLPTAPDSNADTKALYPFSYRLTTTARTPSPLSGTAAAFAQNHIGMFPTHPFLGVFGRKAADDGPFWEIRPIEKSSVDEHAYLSIPPIIKRSLKTRPSSH